MRDRTRNNREIERKFLVKQLPEKLKRRRHYGMFGFEKRAKLHRLLSKWGEARTGKSARSSSAQSSLQHCGLPLWEEDCVSCGTKFHGKIY